MNRLVVLCCLAICLLLSGAALAQNGTGKKIEFGPRKGESAPTAQEELIIWAHFISKAIKHYWKVPAGSVPPHRVARVKVAIGANGTLESYGLSRSSLNAAYDESVLKAMALAKAKEQFAPPPNNATFQFSIDFNSKEQPR